MIAGKNTKAYTVLKMLNKGMSIKDITNKMKVSYGYVYKLKKMMAHKADEPQHVVLDEKVDPELLYQMSQGKGKKPPTQYIEIPEEVTRELSGLLSQVSTARDVQYGGDHYKTKAVQPWDVYDTWPREQRIGAYRANCTKYVMRLDDKDTPLINAQKLCHYAQKLVEVLEEQA